MEPDRSKCTYRTLPLEHYRWNLAVRVSPLYAYRSNLTTFRTFTFPIEPRLSNVTDLIEPRLTSRTLPLESYPASLSSLHNTTALSYLYAPYRSNLTARTLPLEPRRWNVASGAEPWLARLTSLTGTAVPSGGVIRLLGWRHGSADGSADGSAEGLAGGAGLVSGYELAVHGCWPLVYGLSQPQSQSQVRVIRHDWLLTACSYSVWGSYGNMRL